jgi:membrane protein YdbS with pleckstrin-like domain
MARILWEGSPSWRHFSWLYLMSALVAWRAWLFKRFEVPGWEAWLIGALALLATAVVLRRWARYEMTDRTLTVRNGYTGRVIAERVLTARDRVDVWQGPVARLLGIGTVAVSADGQTVLRFRGLDDPEEVKQRIQRLITTAGPSTEGRAA